MPVLFTQQADGWVAADLEAGLAMSLRDSAAVIAPAKGGKWVVLGGFESGVLVNGDALVAGLRVLRDRDAITMPGGAVLFFSAESPARPVEFTGSRPLPCARCTTPIQLGEIAVRCPRCGSWHHHGDESCWTYDTKCNCGHPTVLDGLHVWTPEGL